MGRSNLVFLQSIERSWPMSFFKSAQLSIVVSSILWWGKKRNSTHYNAGLNAPFGGPWQPVIYQGNGMGAERPPFHSTNPAAELF